MPTGICGGVAVIPGIGCPVIGIPRPIPVICQYPAAIAGVIRPGMGAKFIGL